MMLDVENVTSYLLARGLVDASWIVGGDLVIRGITRRNRNLEVEGPDGTGLFLKQADPSITGGGETLLREAEFYRACRDDPDFATLRGFVPRLVDLDEDGPVLIVERIAGASGLRSVLESRDRGEAATGAGFALGSALGRLHGASGSIIGGPGISPPSWLHSAVPWTLRLRHPRIGWLAELSPAGAEVLRIVRREATFAARLDPLASRWRPEALIHGDVRSDNVLVRAGGAEVCLVDWEMVQIGDPAWDLAGALHDFVVRWVMTMPWASDLAAAERAAGAGLPLAEVRRATRAVWSGYRKASGCATREAAELLDRAVAFSAVRLIQTAFEEAAPADRLVGPPVLLLQLAANVLAEPERAVVELYGILPGGPQS